MIAATIDPQEATECEWDCVVVGAGLAGCVAALGLAQRGVKVLLADRKTFPRDKVCGACLNADALAGLRSLGIDDALQALEGVELSTYELSAGQRHVSLRLPSGLAVTRRSLDAMLVTEAIKRGVTFLPDVNLKVAELAEESPKAALRSLRIGTSDQMIRAQAVIMATGLSSDLRFGEQEFKVVTKDNSRIGVGTLATNFPETYQEGRIYMGVGRSGYVGLTRTEGNTLNIAAALDQNAMHGCSPAEACAKILGEAGLAVSDEMLSNPWMGTAALTRRRDSVAGHRIFFVGDAAGYIEPFTGEGMAWAIRGGRGVAAIAMKAVESWDDNCVVQWENATNDLVRHQQSWCHRLAKVLRYPMAVQGLMKVVAVVPALGNYVVRQINKERAHEVFDRGPRHRSAA